MIENVTFVYSLYDQKASQLFFLLLQQVTATDADAGEFGRLTYSLSGDGVEGSEEESAFAIDPLTGAIRLLRVRRR